MSTKKNSVLVLRTCNDDLTSYGQFKWPEKGQVKALDWDPTPECGHGLHGLLWGEGNGYLLNWSSDAKWLVVKVDEDKIVKIDEDKVKFPHGIVVHVGDQISATNYILANGGEGRTIVGANVAKGPKQTAVSGYKGTATAGEGGTATAGEGGTATAGDGGTATAGEDGTATAGEGGTATAGEGGTATAGKNGILNIKYWDEKNSRYRIATAYVGEDGIEPNVAYRLNCSSKKRKFVKV
jgi:hypothetical protein